MPAPTLNAFPVKVVAGVADLVVSNNPGAILATYSLGSCLGITVYDPGLRAGGLLHIMLPNSQLDPTKAVQRPAMFLDTGLPWLLQEMELLRAQKNRLIMCVAGGAQVMDMQGFFNIGLRNYEALKRLLPSHRLRIHADAVGGMVSRSMFLNLNSGEVRLKISGQATETVLWKS